MEFQELREFKKDFKRLLKKYKSLNDDLAIVKQVLEIKPDARPPFSFEISNLSLESCVIKVKKIACRSLKGKGVKSGLRLVYAHFSSVVSAQNSDDKIIFIELYHKNEKTNENIVRIKNNFN